MNGYPCEASISDLETELLERVRAGDSEAFCELIRAHQAHLLGLCRAILGSEPEAQDAAQESLIKAYRGLARFDGRSSFRTWLTRIAINECKDRLRARRRRQTLSLEPLLEAGRSLPRALILETDAPLSPDEGLPEAYLKVLSGTERSMVDLIIQEESFTYAQAADRLGLSVEAWRGRLKRLREKLRLVRDQEEGD